MACCCKSSFLINKCINIFRSLLRQQIMKVTYIKCQIVPFVKFHKMYLALELQCAQLKTNNILVPTTPPPPPHSNPLQLYQICMLYGPI